MINVSFCCSNLPYICLNLEGNGKKNGIEKKKNKGRREAKVAEAGEAKERGVKRGRGRPGGVFQGKERERERLVRVMGVKREDSRERMR